MLIVNKACSHEGGEAEGYWMPQYPRAETALLSLVETDQQLTAEKVKNTWETIDRCMEDKTVNIKSFVVSALVRSSTDPSDTFHPEVMHDELNALLKVLYLLKSCSPDVYDRRITQQFMLQVLWCDTLCLCDEEEQPAPLSDANRKKLSLTLQKMESLDRSFRDGTLAFRSANLFRIPGNMNAYERLGLSSRSASPFTEVENYYRRWRELSGKEIRVRLNDAWCRYFVQQFEEKTEDDATGMWVRTPFMTQQEAVRMKSEICGVDRFEKKEPKPEIAKMIVQKKDMELTMMALACNLISPDPSEIDAAVNAAVGNGDLKVVPMLIKKRWESGE